MTWALVKDTSGKRTFSRLETCSCRPSTRTSWRLTRSPVPAGRSPLLDHVLRRQVVAQPPPRRVAHPAVGGREQRLELRERRGGEAGADVPGVDQPPGVVVPPHEQRSHPPGPPALS